MAEIEPISGAGPGQAEEVATTPVGAPAGGTPPRPRGLVRWGLALLVLAVTVGVVSVAAAMLAAGSSTSVVQGWLPKDTVAYLELRADLPGDQRAKVGDLLAKFPGFADQASLDAKIDEALDRILEGSGASWTTDIKPWLGGEVGLAVTTAALELAKVPDLGSGSLDGPDLGSAPDDGMVALLAVKDPAAAKAWVSKEMGGTQRTETYAGGEITIVSGFLKNDLAFAVRDDVLVLGPEKTVKASLDTGGSSPVATSEPFAAALKTAPDAYIGFGYLDLKAFADAALASAGEQADVPAACRDQLVAALPAWAAGSAQAVDDAIVFESNSPVAGEASTDVKGSASAIASRLPSSTVVAVEIRDFGPGLVSGIETLKEQLACDPSTAEMVDQLEQALAAIGGLEDLLGWAGDTAIAVEMPDGQPGGGLAATVTDEAAASRALQQIQALLALGGSSAGLTVREESYGKGTLLVVQIPSEAAGMEVPELAATVQDGIFALGTIDFVKHVVDTAAGSSLASSETYKRAISAAGGDGVADVFVDLTGLRTAVEAMMSAEEMATYETEVKPFLVPFEAFASVTEAPGTTRTTRAVITFTK